MFAALLAISSIGAVASYTTPQDSSTLSFTITTTTNYQVTNGGPLAVDFDSVQYTQMPPQAYSFGVFAKTYPGFWITNLHWVFGDGAFKDVPYCCQSQVSEVQYHAYPAPGQYTVYVVAYDNAGNFGTAQVTVNWATPIPEYPSYGLPLMASILVLFVALASLRKLKSTSLPIMRL
jgi:PKD repeat protein